jgi:DNA adenine methylase
MKYVGSKDRLSKDLKPIIQSYITEETTGYFEPFVGGANMIDKIECKKKIGSDIHKYLIAVLNELSKGWIPPEDLDEITYKDIQKNYNKYPDYLVGYAGFQLSYGGKWFGGYRRDKIGKRNYSQEAYKNTIKQIPNLKDIKFINKDFRELPLDKIKGFVIYCDIPYRGTTKYHTNEFPYEEFYSWVKTASIYNTVLISEYDMPAEFICIWSKEVKTLLDSNKTSSDDTNTRIERLYTYKM